MWKNLVYFVLNFCGCFPWKYKNIIAILFMRSYSGIDGKSNWNDNEPLIMPNTFPSYMEISIGFGQNVQSCLTEIFSLISPLHCCCMNGVCCIVITKALAECEGCRQRNQVYFIIWSLTPGHSILLSNICSVFRNMLLSLLPMGNDVCICL